MKSYSLPVNLIRQWCYCPRVAYYQELLHIKIERPRWVVQGADFHSREQQLWKRRDLSRFDLQSGEQHHDVFLSSGKLGMHGIADMAIVTRDQVFAVEFKLSANDKKRGDVLQLTGYALLLEEHFNKPSKFGFLVGKGKSLHKIETNEDNKLAAVQVLGEIRIALESGIKPESSAAVAQCCNCEYLNYCNDRL